MSNASQANPDWDEFRRQMPIAEKWAYLDHAAVAPLSGPARQAVVDWANQATEDGTTCWPNWSREVEHVRQIAARMIGADAGEVALVRNTTTGIGLVAEGFSWREGDNVVMPAGEFPSNLYPWMNLASRGVEARRVPMDNGQLDLNRLAEACDERTRIVSASWVGYSDGWRTNVTQLASLAHEHGALLFLDAIQGLGVFPLDVHQAGVDFLAADGHKWMLGPEGAGFFYIRDEHLSRLRPLGGWHSVTGDREFDHVQLDFKPSAARFEGGSENMAGFIALGASLQLLESYGTVALSERLLEITDLACQQLAAAGATILSCRDSEHGSGIVSFDWPGDMKLLRNQLLDRGVVVSYRSGRLRISPHAYSNHQDIDRLIEALQHPG